MAYKRIKMTRTAQGSPNGITILTFQKDQSYTVPEDLAKTLIAGGSAVEEGPLGPEEKAVMAKAPETSGGLEIPASDHPIMKHTVAELTAMAKKAGAQIPKKHTKGILAAIVLRIKGK